jgi:hypothetical protein
MLPYIAYMDPMGKVTKQKKNIVRNPMLRTLDLSALQPNTPIALIVESASKLVCNRPGFKNTAETTGGKE